MTKKTFPPSTRTADSSGFIDLLPAIPSKVPFIDRIRQLALTPTLERKILRVEYILARAGAAPQRIEPLTAEEEKELATEVLLRRHQFSEILLTSQEFRQAALTVLQNIYLFRHRKIFFGNSFASAEAERQEALLLFSSASRCRLPLEKTLQHLIISRVWNRILARISEEKQDEKPLVDLHSVVEQLNTLRNVYMLLSNGLVCKLAAKTNSLYRESISYEDAVQIGKIGVARAAYRYHQSCGVRFSTYAANWIFKEIQRQALDGRLIRISANTVEGFTKAAKSGDSAAFQRYSAIIAHATAIGEDFSFLQPDSHPLLSPTTSLEARQRRSLLLHAINHKLSPRSGDIIKRRYGLPPYGGKEQSVIAISKAFGVTRSCIYQLEQAALRKLQQYLNREAL